MLHDCTLPTMYKIYKYIARAFYSATVLICIGIPAVYGLALSDQFSPFEPLSGEKLTRMQESSAQQGVVSPVSASGIAAMPKEESNPALLDAAFGSLPSSASSAEISSVERAYDVDTVNFSFEGVELGHIVADLARQESILARQRGVHDESLNIILPQGAQALKQQVTIKLNPSRISLGMAKRYVDTLLQMAGYTRIMHNGVQMIVRQEQASRETLPIYVISDPEQLPRTSNRIRVIYYLTHLKVPDRFDPNSQDPVTMILQEMLSPYKSVIFDPKSNAVIIADTADMITSALTVISMADSEGPKSVLEVVPVYNVAAKTLVDLLKNQILALAGDQKGALRADVRSESSLYFGGQPMQIVADTRTNSIIAMGAAPALERLRLLISELDQTPDVGRSMLHFYALQYLDAESFAPVLEAILKSGGAGGSQSTAQAADDGRGKPFEDVIVMAERLVEEKQKETQTDVGQLNPLALPAQVYRGGNRLIITAKYDDWVVIRDLIRDLDRPEPQVIVEVMIIDVLLDESKILGTQLRNKTDLPAPTGVTAQASLSSSPILDDPATTLASDLLRLIDPSSTTPQSLATQLSTGANSGSLIVSANDPNGSGIWGVLQVLDKISTLKILSHPFLVVKNNHTGREDISEIRRNVGQVLAGQAGVLAQKIDDIPATLRVAVVPRVSSLQRVCMQIGVSVTQYTSDIQTDFTRLERLINTNANLSSGEVLVLGGLNVLRERTSSVGTPVLRSIPIIGSFFQNNQQEYVKAHILILMCPTIIDPKIRGGMHIYTRDKINTGYAMFDKYELDKSRDPIARIFFHSSLNDAHATTNNFLSQARGDFVREHELQQGMKSSGSRKAPKRKKKFRN